MGQKLPVALLNGPGGPKKYTDSQLIARAQQVHDGITADPLGEFLTPPVTMVDLQSFIDDYTSACTTAIKGSKAQTNAKEVAKTQLLLALKELSIYVTRIAQVAGTGSPAKLINAEKIILSSGFAASVNPTKPVDPISGIPAPIIRRAVSEDAGTLKILVRQYRNANRNTITYQVNYRTSAIPGTPGTPVGPWQTQTFTGQNQILLTGLDSGVSYDWQIASIGGRDIKRNENPPINFTPISSVIII